MRICGAVLEVFFFCFFYLEELFSGCCILQERVHQGLEVAFSFFHLLIVPLRIKEGTVLVGTCNSCEIICKNTFNF